MATGIAGVGAEAVASCANKPRITTAATWASSFPALDRTCRARSPLLAATAGNRAEKSGGGIELAARARSRGEFTPQALSRAAASDDSDGGVVAFVSVFVSDFDSTIGSLARRTALTAARPIQWAEPSSPMANPQPPAR